MRTLAAKRVAMRAGAPETLETMATFIVDGDRVIAEWVSDSYRREVEQDGIRALVDGEPTRLKPADGLAFFRALDDAYWQSSMVVVDTLTVERA